MNEHPEDSTTRLIDADAPRADEDLIDCAPTHDRYAELAMSRDVVIDAWMDGKDP